MKRDPRDLIFFFFFREMCFLREMRGKRRLRTTVFRQLIRMRDTWRAVVGGRPVLSGGGERGVKREGG